VKKVFYLAILPSILLADSFSVKTFGTLSGVNNDNENFYFRRDTLHKDGSSGDIDYNTDTVLGIQPTYEITDNSAFVLQAIYQKDYHDEYKPSIDWGYYKYSTHDNATFKLGRIRNHFYLNSENLNIGYSTLKIREHIELYGQVPNTGFYGGSVQYSDILGKYFYDFQLSYGKESFVAPIHTLNQNIDIDLKNLYISNLAFGTPEYQLRLTYLNADISAKNPTLDGIFSGLRDEGNDALANKYDLTNRKSTYAGIGLSVDKDDFILTSEYGYRSVPGFYVDMSSFYVTSGYRFDNFIPYLSYAKSKMDQKLTLDTAPTTLSEGGLEKILIAQNVAQSTRTIGFKYFINENIDLKVQYDYIKPIGVKGGAYVRTALDTGENTNLNVLSFAVDFVY